MSTIRQQRVAEMLYEELSIMIANELDDPRLSLVQVTHVDVSRDLRNVKVYVSHDDDELSKRNVLQGLRHAIPYLRRQLAVRVSLRAVPELSFYYDDTPEKAARIDELLRQIAANRDGNASDGAADGASGGTPSNAASEDSAVPPAQSS